MTVTKLLIPVLAALSAPFLALDAATPPPPPGPGGVIHAMQGFCAAVDRGDADYLAKAMAKRGAGGPYGFDRENGRIRQLEGSSFALFDVTAASEPFAATDQADFVGRMIKDVAHGNGKVETVIHSIRADCPSGDCSYAFLEFDRVFTNGDVKTVVPMRATALVRHTGEGAPDFRVFHWHASLAGAPDNEARKGGGN